MRKYKSILKKDKELIQIVCDWCGKKSGKDCFFEGGCGEVSFGYGSKKQDGRKYEFDICDGCFSKRIKPHAELVCSWIWPPDVAEFKKARKKLESLKEIKNK